MDAMANALPDAIALGRMAAYPAVRSFQCPGGATAVLDAHGMSQPNPLTRELAGCKVIIFRTRGADADLGT